MIMEQNKCGKVYAYDIHKSIFLLRNYKCFKFLLVIHNVCSTTIIDGQA